MRNKMIGVSAFLAIAMFAVSGCTQKSNTDPQLPDLTQLNQLSSQKVPSTLNGKDIELENRFYQKTDMANLKIDSADVLYKDGLPWLALYVQEIGEKHPDGTVTTKEAHVYLFENKNGKWNFVKDFSTSTQKDVTAFAKSTYKLEFK